jgi:sugar phosphate permease
MRLSLALQVFLPFALGYFISYVFRTVNSIIAPNLVSDLGLTAADLGFLTSVFFLAFAFLQLPLGLLLDRFGPRWVNAGLLLLAALGAAIFGLAQSLGGLSVGRALIGVGVSACMMAAFKAFVQWFPPERLPLVNSALLALGASGALAATLPVEWALGFTSWRTLFIVVALATVAVAVLVVAVTPEHDDPPQHASFSSQLAGLRQVLRSRFFWALAPLTTASQGAFLALQGLWAGPWLRDVAGMDRVALAEVLGGMSIALVVGFLTFGAAADSLRRRGVTPLMLSVGGMAVFAGVQVLLIFAPVAGAPLLWLAFGFFGAAGTLPYAVLSQAFPKAVAGRVNAALNLLVFVAAFLTQWGLGALLHLWEDPVTNTYAPSGYGVSLALLAALQFLTLAWLWRQSHHLRKADV